MTQRSLAKNIISIPYLSKIENGSVKPSAEIIELLCKKLNINPSQEKSKWITDLCTNWFKALFYKNIDKAHLILKAIEENIQLISNKELRNLLEIHKLRYYLILENKLKASQHYLRMKAISNEFGNKEKYYWLKFVGYYYFSNSSYNKSIHYFMQAEEYSDSSIYLIQEEKHNLYYMIALTGSYARKTGITLDYADKALIFFQKHYYLKQASECHILLGITFSRIRDYEKSIDNYKLSKEIAESNKDNNILAISIQNIGNLYSLSNNHEESIGYYLKSYELQKNSSCDKKIIPIASLMKEYYKTHDMLSAKKWLVKGLNVMSSKQLESVYVYELKVFEQLINGFKDSFEDLILNRALPFLEKKELYQEKTLFLEILGDYYFNRRKYRLSASYYNYALNIKNNI